MMPARPPYVLGMPDLAIIEMPRGLTNLTPGEVLEIAANLKPQVLAACKPQAFRKEKLWATELDPSTKIPSMEGADCLHLVVVGGAAGKGQYLDEISEPATVSIDRYLP